jgi:hypothetical protein
MQPAPLRSGAPVNAKNRVGEGGTNWYEGDMGRVVCGFA